jgi:uncharacterized protein YndB with AHSA1/START domain
MRSFIQTIHIDRSPAQVWAYMMDFEKASQWRNSVRDMRIVTDGPLRTGSEVEIAFDLPGGRRSWRCEVCAFETARRFGLRTTTKKVTATFEYVLVPEGAGTFMTYTCDLSPRGVMWLLLPMMIRANRERYAHQLVNLKRAIERGDEPGR